LRYLDIDTISFTDKDGNTFPVKDIRPIPVEATSLSIPPNSATMLDEVASRSQVYGDLGEDQTYRIFDANTTLLLENNFNVSKLAEIKIPL